jgi:hypothetical protein
MTFIKALLLSITGMVIVDIALSMAQSASELAAWLFVIHDFYCRSLV